MYFWLYSFRHGCQVYSCIMPDDVVIDLDGYDWAGEGLSVIDWLWRWALDQTPQRNA